MLVSMKAGCLLLACAIPVFADGVTQFQARRASPLSATPGKGWCDIRLIVDGEADVSLRADRIFARNVTGPAVQDDGSECSVPLPDGPVHSFRFEAKGRRNDVRLLEQPAAQNAFTALVRIRDTAPGAAQYRFRVSWEDAGVDRRPWQFDNPDQPPTGAGFSWNNTTSFKGDGRGRMTVDDGELKLRKVGVEVDQSGKVAVWFRADGRKLPVTFTGQLLANEHGRLKVDSMSEDRRMRGSMWITIDTRQRLESISLDATDGRDRLSLSWERH
jgi:hypothetical protein